MIRRILQVTLPFVFVAVSLVLVVGMVLFFRRAPAIEPVVLPRVVEVVPARADQHAAVVLASGAVEPDQAIELVAEVQGKVVEIAPGLAPGLPLAKGDLIARIDARDFRNQVAQAEASVRQAELNLAIERGRSAQSEREWALLGQAAPDGLARREPQLAAAVAGVESARAALDTARHQLQRTRIVAPFDAVIVQESLDVGQFVAPGASVARLYGTERYRVRVSVPVASLRWLDLPDADGSGGASAEVAQVLPDGTMLSAEGRVSRLFGELDPQTRTATLLVHIDPPPTAVDRPPLLPGAWVDVTLRGRPRGGLVQVPRVALREGEQLYVADAEDKLRRRDAVVVFGDREHVYVDASGLVDGDRVIISPMSMAVDGLSLVVQTAVAAR